LNRGGEKHTAWPGARVFLYRTAARTGFDRKTRGSTWAWKKKTNNQVWEGCGSDLNLGTAAGKGLHSTYWGENGKRPEVKIRTKGKQKGILRGKNAVNDKVRNATAVNSFHQGKLETRYNMGMGKKKRQLPPGGAPTIDRPTERSPEYKEVYLKQTYY